MVAQIEEIQKREYSVRDFITTFTEDYCLDYFKTIRYPEAVYCPACGYEGIYMTNRGYKCAAIDCNKKFNVLTNTIFQNTKLPLHEWFFVIYCNSMNKKNISSVQTSKNTGMTQTSAWVMQSRLRSVMVQDNIKLSGIVEVDEAFISKGQWHRWGSLYTRKTPVLGLVQRGGLVVLRSMQDRRKETIIPIIQQHVEKNSTIYTDGYQGYRRLDEYLHDYVEHSYMEFVRGTVHTNTIENVWSFFKRNIRNAHHSISNKHLQSYLDEAAFKFNTRHLTQMERFDQILKRCIYG
jgi:transposase-like protein